MALGEDDEVGAMKAGAAVGQLADLGGGDRATLVALGKGELALGQDSVLTELFGEDLRSRGAAEPVVDGTRRDDGRRHPKADVAEPSAGGADQTRLAAKQVEALEEAAVDAGRNAAVGRSLTDVESDHDVADRDDAVSSDIGDKLAVAASAKDRGR